ncbi:MAG: thioesterase family protein [Nocardiopsaceae bacterium]|nr:thioesterase family protein [Nocardiopsaceae bacterium]
MGETAAATVTRQASRSPRRHVYFAHIRFADLDPLNHVNNVQMLTYLEDARISLFGEGTRAGFPFGGIVIARNEIDYLHPISLRPEPVRVETRVTEVKNASFRLEYEILDDDRVYARAASVAVGFDTETQSARRLTAEEREFLGGYLEDGHRRS